MKRSIAFLLLFVCCTPLAAEDWPQFRGPLGNGHSAEKNLPIQWSATENVVWKTAVPGKGWSSPSLYNGRLYLTTAVPVDEAKPTGNLSLRTLCLSAKDGTTIWDVEVFQQDGETAPKIHTKNSHASPTPLIDADRVFVHFGHQGTACLDLDGKLIWKNQDLKYPPVHGNGASPILVEGLLIFSCDGGSDPFVVALDSANGSVRWKFQREVDYDRRFAFCTCDVITVNGKKQVISPGAGVVNALDPQTGKEIWQVKYDGYSVIPRPVFGHGLVYLSTGYNNPQLMAIRHDGTGDVTDTHVAWQVKSGAPHTPSPLLIGDELYMVSDGGIATCLDAKTGEEHWHERIGGNFSSSPTYADGKIYLQDEEGKGTVLKPGTKLQKLGENGFAEKTQASYAVGDGAIFVRTESNLYKVAQPRR